MKLLIVSLIVMLSITGWADITFSNLKSTLKELKTESNKVQVGYIDRLIDSWEGRRVKSLSVLQQNLQHSNETPLCLIEWGAPVSRTYNLILVTSSSIMRIEAAPDIRGIELRKKGVDEALLAKIKNFINDNKDFKSDISIESTSGPLYSFSFWEKGKIINNFLICTFSAVYFLSEDMMPNDSKLIKDHYNRTQNLGRLFLYLIDYTSVESNLKR